MKYPVNYNKVTVKTEFYDELIKVHNEAENYLLSFAWCSKIKDSELYFNLGSTLCIFLFEIENSGSKDDNYLWVIAGDIPFMHLDIHGPKTTKQVLEDYVRLAEDWINQVNIEKSIEHCYPFKAEPMFEMATLLQKRTFFIKNTLIGNIDDIPILIK